VLPSSKLISSTRDTWCNLISVGNGVRLLAVAMAAMLTLGLGEAHHTRCRRARRRYSMAQRS
jgi:hypothetical protein